LHRFAIPPWGILAGLLLSFCPPAAAQELGVFTTIASSDHVEFPSPAGFGGSALFEITPSLLVRLAFQRISDETLKIGTVCRIYSPRIECGPEMTETSITLTGLRAGLFWAHGAGDFFRFRLGGGGSFNQAGAEANGVSGRRADFLLSHGASLGAFGRVSIAVAPYASIPFRITGGFTSHWAFFDVCSGEDPPAYDPLCETGRFTEFEIGLAYEVPRG
jgi:hypothetical protein